MGTAGTDALLDDCGPFTSLEAAQAAVDGFVAQYNCDRPHQALDPNRPVTPAERFTPIPDEQRELLTLWLPPTIAPALTPAEEAGPGSPPGPDTSPVPPRWAGGPVELDRGRRPADLRSATKPVGVRRQPKQTTPLC